MLRLKLEVNLLRRCPSTKVWNHVPTLFIVSLVEPRYSTNPSKRNTKFYQPSALSHSHERRKKAGTCDAEEAPRRAHAVARPESRSCLAPRLCSAARHIELQALKPANRVWYSMHCMWHILCPFKKYRAPKPVLNISRVFPPISRWG